MLCFFIIRIIKLSNFQCKSKISNIIYIYIRNIQNYSDSEIYEFEIDNNETFGTLRRKVAEAVKIPNNSLILVGREEYSREFNS